MNNDLNIKVIGEDLSNLFLAFLLLKKGFKVKIFKKNNFNKKKSKDKGFFISHSTFLTLDNFNLWSQLKDNAYPIDSLSFLDISTLKKIDFSYRDFKFNKSNYNIGWIINYSDFYNLLLSEISKFDDVFSEFNIQLNSDIKDNTYNFKSTLNKSIIKRIFCPSSSKNNISSIEFNASLRGYIDNRYYSIISEKGLIFLCPIYKNLFSVKWIIKKSFFKRFIRFESGLFLDNLSSILPKELEVDQIFGGLNITTIYPEIFKRVSETDNYLIINDGSIKLFDFRLEGLNLSLSEVIYIYEQIKNINFNNKKTYAFLKFKFLVTKFFKLEMFIILYQIFIVNNYLLNFLKKIIYYLFKKLKIFKMFFYKLIIIKL